MFMALCKMRPQPSGQPGQRRRSGSAAQPVGVDARLRSQLPPSTPHTHVAALSLALWQKLKLNFHAPRIPVLTVLCRTRSASPSARPSSTPSTP